MVNSLNDVFNPIRPEPPGKLPKPPQPKPASATPPIQPKEQRRVSKPPQTPPAAIQVPKTRIRKERSDKRKDMKFPVTPEQREDLRKRASEMRIADRKPELKYETISNTAILKQAMEHNDIFPEQYPPLLYKDTGQYMHAELLLPDYQKIEELARRWNLSIRKTVHRLIMNYIFRGDVDSDAYRKSQQQQ